MKFADVIGQQDVKERLTRSVKENRVSHAQLFLGHSGCGVLALALAYAQYIHCENRSGEDACGTCKSCIKHQKLVHPDLHFAYPFNISKDKSSRREVCTDVLTEWRETLLENPYMESDNWLQALDAENKQLIIPVSESNEIIKKLSYTTFESEYKIMIIWMADKMNAASANKLLKILEEPPDKTLFLLIVENEDQLLKTILSRTQLVKVKSIDDVTLVNALMQRHSLSENEAKAVAHLAEGNYNAALKLMSENETVDDNLETFQLWMRACLKFNMEAINQLIGKFSDMGREQQKNFLAYCSHLVRESLMMNYADASLVRVTDKEAAFLKKFSVFIHENNCLRFADALNEAAQHIERNANPKILFLDVSFTFNELLNIKETA